MLCVMCALSLHWRRKKGKATFRKGKFLVRERERREERERVKKLCVCMCEREIREKSSKDIKIKPLDLRGEKDSRKFFFILLHN